MQPPQAMQPVQIADLSSAVPLTAGRSGRLSGFAEVNNRSVRYFTPEGEAAGVDARRRIELEKAPGLSSGMGDEYSLGIIGNLNAVIKTISEVSLFKLAALNVIKAVPEVARIFCATSNPTQVVVARTESRCAAACDPSNGNSCFSRLSR